MTLVVKGSFTITDGAGDGRAVTITLNERLVTRADASDFRAWLKNMVRRAMA